MPAENLITPEYVRRICWDQTRADLTTVQEKLAKLGARAWQIDLVAPLLTEALTHTEPLAEPDPTPEEAPPTE